MLARRLLPLSLGLAAAIVPVAFAAQAKAPGLPTTALYVAGTEGYVSFRIPALLVTAKGTVLAFAEGRKKSSNDDGDVDLVCRRSTDGGKSFGPLQRVYEEGGDEAVTIGNPCAVVDQPSGTIILTFCRNNRDVFVTRSLDDGRSWSRPEEITKQVKRPDWTWYATGPGIGIQLERGPHKGRLVIPCDHRVLGETIGSFAHVFYSDDHGKSWKLGGSSEYGTNECQVLERLDGSLLLNMRRAEDREGSDRSVAVSQDGGMTWSTPVFDKSLFTPRCQIGLVRAAPGKPQVVFTSPVHPSARWHLTARLSDDDGRTWSVARVIHPLRAAYSSLGVLPDGTLLCLYEGGKEHYKENILLARFDLAWVRGGGSNPTAERPALPEQ